MNERRLIGQIASELGLNPCPWATLDLPATGRLNIKTENDLDLETLRR